jgi:hypothetical protein
MMLGKPQESSQPDVVPYDQQTVNARNPIVRFSHRRRMRLSTDKAAAIVPRSGVLADYGAGPGKFLNDIRTLRPDIEAVGFEPFQAPGFPGLRYVATPDAIASHSVDVFTILETFEHLELSELADVFAVVDRVLGNDGRLLVSVPIIEGLTVVPKELNRRRLYRRREHTNGELFAAMVGRPVTRAADIKASHKGFSFQALERLLASRYAPVERWYSPFPHLPWWLNSQSFTLWRRLDVE